MGPRTNNSMDHLAPLGLKGQRDKGRSAPSQNCSIESDSQHWWPGRGSTGQTWPLHLLPRPTFGLNSTGYQIRASWWLCRGEPSGAEPGKGEFNGNWIWRDKWGAPTHHLPSALLICCAFLCVSSELKTKQDKGIAHSYWLVDGRRGKWKAEKKTDR
jgi:hypothetical protein